MWRSTGRRRYNHPAISGRLPIPWLPAGQAEYTRIASDIMPSSSDIEDIQQPLDIDLSSSGAILIDIRRRFKDVTNIAKRVAVSSVEAIRPSQQQQQQQSTNSRSRRVSNGLRDEADYVENSTDAWARDGRLVSSSVPSRQGSAAHDEEDSDEEEEGNAASRYTFFPHRQRAGSQGGLSENSKSGNEEGSGAE